MIPIIDRYKHFDFYIDGLHHKAFSGLDLHNLIQQSPYRCFSTPTYQSGWVIEHPAREEEVDDGWYEEEAEDADY